MEVVGFVVEGLWWRVGVCGAGCGEGGGAYVEDGGHGEGDERWWIGHGDLCWRILRRGVHPYLEDLNECEET